MEEFAGLQAEAMWTTLLFGGISSEAVDGSQEEKDDFCLGDNHNEQKYFRVQQVRNQRAETEAAREQREAWTISPPFFFHISLLF